MKIKNEPIISLSNVTQTFERSGQKNTALKNISLEIHQGEFIVVLGPSGCGKSTMLNLIAGFIQPTEGVCLMHGKEIKEADARRGVVFQSASLYPWLTVEKNINFGLRVKKEAPADVKIKTDEMLKEIMLEDYRHYHTYELSGGMRQRVALGRALINDPEILLLDEPFGALDSFTRLSMQKLLLKLWGEKERTFFLITHDIEEALLLATKIIVLSKHPGEICGTFAVDFNKKMRVSPDYHISMDKEFNELKVQIMDLIMAG